MSLPLSMYGQETGSKVFDQGTTIIISALTTIAVIAWADVIRQVLTYLFPSELTRTQNIIYRSIYAIVITLVVAVVIVVITQAKRVTKGIANQLMRF